MTQFAAGHTFFERLRSFFEWADESHLRGDSEDAPLFALGQCWDFWQLRLVEAERAALENAAQEMSEDAREDVVARLHEWLSQRHRRDGSAKLILMQLARLNLFQAWRALDRYREGRMKAVQAVVLHQVCGGDANDVVPLIVLLLAREPGDPAIRRCGFESFGDIPFEHICFALRSLLGRVGLLLIMLLSVFAGWATSSPRMRLFLIGGWGLVAGGFLSLYGFGQRLSHDVVVAILYGMLTLSGLLILRMLAACFQELRVAWRAGRLLEESQLCIVPGTGANVSVIGSSFTLSICVGALSALFEAAPPGAGSWIWGPFAEKFDASRKAWAFSASVQANGSLYPVERVPDKHKASFDHPRIFHIAIPVQDRHLPEISVRPESLASDLATGARAATPSTLHLHRCSHLASVILRIGEIGSWGAVLTSVLALIVTGALLSVRGDIRAIVSPSPEIRLVPEGCGEVRFPDGVAFRLEVQTPSPEIIRVRLPREGVLIPLESKGRVSQATVDIRLADLTTNFGPDQDTWEFQLVRSQSFLNRPLQDIVVLRLPYNGVTQEADDAYHRLYPDGR